MNNKIQIDNQNIQLTRQSLNTVKSINFCFSNTISKYKTKSQIHLTELGIDLVNLNSNINIYENLIINELLGLQSTQKSAHIIKCISDGYKQLFSMIKKVLYQYKSQLQTKVQNSQEIQKQKCICTKCNKLLEMQNIQVSKLELGVGQFQDPFNLYNRGQCQFTTYRKQQQEQFRYRNRLAEVWQNKKNIEQKMYKLSKNFEKKQYNYQYSLVQTQQFQNVLKQQIWQLRKNIGYEKYQTDSNFMHILQVLVNKIVQKLRICMKNSTKFQKGCQSNQDTFTQYVKNLEIDNHKIKNKIKSLNTQMATYKEKLDQYTKTFLKKDQQISQITNENIKLTKQIQKMIIQGQVMINKVSQAQEERNNTQMKYHELNSKYRQCIRNNQFSKKQIKLKQKRIMEIQKKLQSFLTNKELDKVIESQKKSNIKINLLEKLQNLQQKTLTKIQQSQKQLMAEESKQSTNQMFVRKGKKSKTTLNPDIKSHVTSQPKKQGKKIYFNAQNTANQSQLQIKQSIAQQGKAQKQDRLYSNNQDQHKSGKSKQTQLKIEQIQEFYSKRSISKKSAQRSNKAISIKIIKSSKNLQKQVFKKEDDQIQQDQKQQMYKKSEDQSVQMIKKDEQRKQNLTQQMSKKQQRIIIKNQKSKYCYDNLKKSSLKLKKGLLKANKVYKNSQLNLTQDIAIKQSFDKLPNSKVQFLLTQQKSTLTNHQRNTNNKFSVEKAPSYTLDTALRKLYRQTVQKQYCKSHICFEEFRKAYEQFVQNLILKTNSEQNKRKDLNRNKTVNIEFHDQRKPYSSLYTSFISPLKQSSPQKQNKNILHNILNSYKKGKIQCQNQQLNNLINKRSPENMTSFSMGVTPQKQKFPNINKVAPIKDDKIQIFSKTQILSVFHDQGLAYLTQSLNNYKRYHNLDQFKMEKYQSKYIHKIMIYLAQVHVSMPTIYQQLKYEIQYPFSYMHEQSEINVTVKSSQFKQKNSFKSQKPDLQKIIKYLVISHRDCKQSKLVLSKSRNIQLCSHLINFQEKIKNIIKTKQKQNIN